VAILKIVWISTLPLAARDDGNFGYIEFNKELGALKSARIKDLLILSFLCKILYINSELVLYEN
jgi:hypothetical protein